MSKIEQVLVIPTRVFHGAGHFQGFSKQVEFYLSRLFQPGNLFFHPRDSMEANPDFKQIIPYVVLKWREQIFNYVRGKKASETRLQALRSIGVGGHINPGDQNLFTDPYRQGMYREVEEEVIIETDFTERCIGLINDDRTPVGQVHLGIVHIFELREPKVIRRDQGLTKAGFHSLLELKNQKEEFETWSQFVLDQL